MTDRIKKCEMMKIKQRTNQIFNNRKRITAILMIFVVLMFVLLSTYFIAHEADHDCTGEDCPVCALIQMSGNNLRELGSGVPVSAEAVSLIIFIMVMQLSTECGIIISTPISRKTRLNN